MSIPTRSARRSPRLASILVALSMPVGSLFAAPLTTETPSSVPYAADAATLRALIPFNDARDTALYQQHVLTLSNPFFEGRGPGTRGNRLAAEYLEHQFKTLGLKPVFVETEGGPANSYMQTFTAGTEAVAGTAEFALVSGESRTTLVPNADFTVLGFSSDANLTVAPMVFVGYALEDAGTDESPYTSFAENDDLTGKIAVLLRFEPMTDEGKSLWRDGRSGWTGAAGLGGKIRNTLARGAAGVIVINPPGTQDPRVEKLESTAASASWMRRQDVPIVLLSPEAGDRLVRAADAQGRSLLDLRRLADTQTEPNLIPLSNASLALNVALERRPRVTWNVAGLLPGRGDLAEQVIIVGAHFDHVGYGYTGGSRSNELGVIHPGADDNASGTTGMILAADLLSRAYAQLPSDISARSILFIGFSAEEMGLIGSRYFVRNNPFSATAVYAMLNLDMIGRLRDRKLEIAGTGTAKGLRDLVVPLFEEAGFEVNAQPGGRGPSDHASFYAADIPVLHLFTGLHDEYHTPRDTADLINHEGGVDITHGLSEFTIRLATRPEPLEFTSTDRGGARRGRGDRAAGDEAQDDQPRTPMGNVRIRFGISPGTYAEDETGVLVGEVFPNTSAADAGIIAGDRLTKWNGEAIPDVAGWMEFLAKHAPGDVVQVTLMREGQELTLPVTLRARERRDQ
ncbi:MAG: M28 family peptidase [Phycisphaeraceae bacterium]|nr:M28 family peptidase [Phycisphaeraceae bacterium]